MMPLMIRRSSARFGPVSPLGRCRSIPVHCLSFSQNKPARTLMLLAYSKEDHVLSIRYRPVFEVRVVRAGLEKAPENPGFDPIAISLEDTGPLAKVGRQVTPRAACPHNPKHRLDEAAVVAPAAAGGRRLTQAMQLHLRPLGVRQYKAFHPKLESQPSSQRYPESQQTLDDIACGIG